MNISLVSAAMRNIPNNRALVKELSAAVKVDEETVSVMSTSCWGFNRAQWGAVDAIKNHNYTGDEAMAIAFYAGNLNGIYETRRFFQGV